MHNPHQNENLQLNDHFPKDLIIFHQLFAFRAWKVTIYFVISNVRPWLRGVFKPTRLTILINCIFQMPARRKIICLYGFVIRCKIRQHQIQKMKNQNYRSLKHVTSPLNLLLFFWSWGFALLNQMVCFTKEVEILFYWTK